MTGIPDATLAAFVSAWNERDPAARRLLLQTAWAQSGEFSDATETVVGLEALNTHIGAVLAGSPRRMFEHRGWLEGLGGRTGFRWRVRTGGKTVSHGYASAEVGADGRLTRVAMFVEPDQPKEEGSLAKLRVWALANPIAVAGFFVLVIYVVLRLQAQRFYATFGVTPEDAGFGPVDLVVRQSSAILLEFARAGLVWGVGYLIGMVPSLFLNAVRRSRGTSGLGVDVVVVFVLSIIAGFLALRALLLGDWLVGAAALVLVGVLLLVPRFLYPGSDAPRASARADLFRWGVTAVPLGALFYATGTFALIGFDEAESDAALVHDGGSIISNDFPWRARPVNVEWKTEDPPFALPSCGGLAYLGEGNGRVVLYDRRNNQTIRLVAGDVQLTFPQSERCMTSAARPAQLLSPDRTRVGESVSASARNLVPGDYRLYLAATLYNESGRVSCLGAVSSRVRVKSGRGTFRGTVPGRLNCYQGVTITRFAVEPGDYHFQVGSPAGPGAFSPRRSLAIRNVTVIR